MGLKLMVKIIKKLNPEGMTLGTLWAEVMKKRLNLP